MTTHTFHNLWPSRIGAWLILQLSFAFFVYPRLGNWLNRQTDVWFYFIAFAFALVSIAVVIPMFAKASKASRILIVIMLAVPVLEILGSIRGLLSYF
jgi:hypothetical protein